HTVYVTARSPPLQSCLFRFGLKNVGQTGVEPVKLTLLFVALMALSLLSAPAFAQVAGKPKADERGPAGQAKPRTNDPSKDSDEDLRRAIQASGGSETQIITNLEDYLKKYPNSGHREEIEGELYKLSMKSRDRNRAITYAERLVISDET